MTYYTIDIPGCRSICPKFNHTASIDRARREARRIIRAAQDRGLPLPYGVRVYSHESLEVIRRAGASNWSRLGCECLQF